MNEKQTLLIERYLEGGITVSERNELSGCLRTDPTSRHEFASEVQLHGWITVALADPGTAVDFRERLAGRLQGSAHPGALAPVLPPAPAPDRGWPPETPPRPRAMPARPGRPLARRRRPLARLKGWVLAGGGLLAAACCLIALRQLWTMDHQLAQTPPDRAAVLASIDGLSGTVRLVVAGQASQPLAAGCQLHGGDRLVTGANAHATLHFPDATSIVMGDLADLTIAEEHGAKRCALTQGTITATIARQPPGLPMVFRTSQASATVLGTRLILSAGASTRLAVIEGRVAFAPASAPGSGQVLEAGQSAAATALTLQMIEPPPADALWAQAVAAAVPPTPTERGWQDIPWQTDLWASRRRSHESGKPMLLWIGQGHPLGMAYSDCLIDRQTAWGDPALRAVVSTRFVPVAGDGWFLSRRQDAVGRFFAAIVAQSQRPNIISQGVYCVTADGTLLAQCSCGSGAEQIRQTLESALRHVDGAHSAPVPDAGASDRRYDPQPPPSALVLVASARWLIADGGAYRPARDALEPAYSAPGREVLWLSSEEWHRLVTPALRTGAQQPFPVAVARKLVRYGLLDTTHGESMPWEATDITALALTLAASEISPTLVRWRMHGTVAIAAAQRSYKAELVGRYDYDPLHDALIGFELTALGTHQGQEITATRTPSALLGVEMRSESQPQAGVVPHGLRDAGYYLEP